jgi:hypothetical protein
MQTLQTLSSIPIVQLSLEWVGIIADGDHPCMDQWLKQHAQLISHITVDIHVSEERLTLMDFSEAAVPCRSVDLSFSQSNDQPVNLAGLAPVAELLQSLKCQPNTGEHAILQGICVFNNTSQLTSLHLQYVDFGSEDPWGLLAKLTNLQQLDLSVGASGDPSPLSALTGLSYLDLESYDLEAAGRQ